MKELCSEIGIVFYLTLFSRIKLGNEKLSLPKNSNFNLILLSPELDRLVVLCLTPASYSFLLYL